MAKTATPVFAQNAYIKTANLSTINACTTRGPTLTAGLAGANIIPLVPADSANGRRIDKIVIKASSTSIVAPTVAQVVGIWLYDGTTAYMIDEITITATTPSTTSSSFLASKSFDPLLLPASFALYVSTTVTTTAATTALTVTAFGGDY